MTAYKAQLKLEVAEGTALGFQGNVGEKHLRLDSGKGATSPSPVDALLVALAGCAGMDVISILRKMRQDVTAYTVEALGERRDEHPRVFTRIELIHRVYGHDLNAKSIEHAVELSDTKYCSVHAMLRDSVEITSRFEVLAAAAAESAS